MNLFSILLFLLLVSESLSTCGPDDGKLFHDLTRRSGEDWKFEDKQLSNNYRINVCTPLILPCGTQSGSGAYVYAAQPDECFRLGNPNDMKWSSGHNYANLTYGSGDECYIRYTKYSMTINFECSPTTEGNIRAVDVFEKCSIQFYFLTKYACDDYWFSPPSLSSGSVFLIILFVSSFLYLSVGIFYKIKWAGAEGMEVIPNIEFWRGLPSLVGDGCSYTYNCLSGKEGSYGSLEDNQSDTYQTYGTPAEF